jgi:hypothetical protein
MDNYYLKPKKMSGIEQYRKIAAAIPEWTPEGFGIPTGVQEPTTPLQINATPDATAAIDLTYPDSPEGNSHPLS